MQEIIKKRESIFQGRVVKLEVLDVELSNGKPSKRELITHPGAVAILALDADQNILLVRQFRIAAGQVLYEIPAGTLEPNEEPIVCAERELQEETGYKPNHIERLGGIYVAPGYTTEFIHLFFATELQDSRLQMDEDEFIEVSRVTFQQAFEMIDRGVIIDGKSISAILLGARKLGV